jgi:hypothetical protein
MILKHARGNTFFIVFNVFVVSTLNTCILLGSTTFVQIFLNTQLKQAYKTHLDLLFHQNMKVQR